MDRDDRSLPIAASLDAFSIMLFVIIGRRNHNEDSAMGGTLSTAAPFLVALLVAWLIVRAWRRPTDVRTGMRILPIVIAGGMLLRRWLFDDGTATSFVIVTTLFLGLLIIGWRAVWLLVATRRRAHTTPIG